MKNVPFQEREHVPAIVESQETSGSGRSDPIIAGPKHQGKAQGAIRWHGQQSGVVQLSNRKLRVRKPRLRHKEQGEVEVPAYQAVQTNSSLASRMLDILLRGVSTRNYEAVLPEMAQTVGVSKSSVSREAIAASVEVVKELAERRFDDKDILLIYVDGLRFGRHHVLAAVGVDSEGNKHVGLLRVSWPRRKSSASSRVTNCFGCSKLTWMKLSRRKWQRREKSVSVFTSGAARNFQLRAGHDQNVSRLGRIESALVGERCRDSRPEHPRSATEKLKGLRSAAKTLRRG